MKILYLGPIDGTAWIQEELGEGFEVVRAEPTPESVGSLLPGSEAIIDASMKVPLGPAELALAPSLRIILTATTGADHIHAATLEQRGIPLLTLKGQTEILRQVNPAAELSWLLLMACARKFRAAIRHVEQGGWDRTLFPGTMLRGKTLGILGCGRNGQWMAKYATAFEMRVLGFDPHLKDWPPGIEQRPLDDLLATSDFVAIHVTYNADTENLLSADRIARMKPGACLINTSRGQIADSAALVAALDEDRLSAIGVDVLAAEPDITRDPIWQKAQTDDRIVITPHIGGFSPDALQIVIRSTANRLRTWRELRSA